VKVSIFALSGGICNTGNAALIGPLEYNNNPVDISSISPSVTELCVVASLTSENGISPVITNTVLTYQSPNRPSLTFDTIVQENLSMLVEGKIPNTATIETPTAEINMDNNSDDHLFSVPVTDLEVTKSVDRTAVAFRDTLIYTITYKNNGPSPSA
jgi:hypothetical protein